MRTRSASGQKAGKKLRVSVILKHPLIFDANLRRVYLRAMSQCRIKINEIRSAAYQRLAFWFTDTRTLFIQAVCRLYQPPLPLPIFTPPPPLPTVTPNSIPLPSGFWKMSAITVRLSNTRLKPSIIQLKYKNLCTKFWQKFSDATFVSTKMNISCKFEIKFINLFRSVSDTLKPNSVFLYPQQTDSKI